MSNAVKDSFDRFCRNAATLQDLEILSAAAEGDDAQQVMTPLLQEQWNKRQPDARATEAESIALANAILEQTGFRKNTDRSPVHFLRQAWLRYAAAAVIILTGIATAVMVSNHQSSRSTGIVSQSTSGILPGTNKAVLTLDDKHIDLSSGKTGITVGNRITYNDGEAVSETGMKMMLATPNGGQYQLALPDGTKAWLNAASSISFPSVFSGGKRQVKVTGEVYLEVAQDKSKPFLVDINGKSTVQVLGTSFNINSYESEKEIKTTLIDGSIQVTANADGDPGSGNPEKAGPINKVILKPGQQALQPIHSVPGKGSEKAAESGAPEVTVRSGTDLEQVLAWKNGLFNFNGLSLPEVLAQLARWYDIQVKFEGKVPSLRIMGEMYRSAQLPDVLKMLEKMEIRFRMEGRTLIVL